MIKKISIAALLSALFIPRAGNATITWQAPFILGGPSTPSDAYQYAPSSITDWPNDYHFYCGTSLANPAYESLPGTFADYGDLYKLTSAGTFQVKDAIFLRHLQYVNNNWIVVREPAVLRPGAPGAWDSRHVCDPNVLKGVFNLNGTTYTYAMFYTGTADTGGSHENAVGLAVSNDMINWVKSPNPLIPLAHPKGTVKYYDGNGVAQLYWGAGQPSATAINGAGQILLFYTRDDACGGVTATYVKHLDISNVNAPVVLHDEKRVPETGLSLGTGAFNNADFVYDPDVVNGVARDRFYAIHSSAMNAVEPSFITTELEVATVPAATIWTRVSSAASCSAAPDAYQAGWTSQAKIYPNSSSSPKAKNDNAGIHRTPYGMATSPTQIRVNFTGADNQTFYGSQWVRILNSYRVYSIFGDVQ